jgi:hypothetical protein
VKHGRCDEEVGEEKLPLPELGHESLMVSTPPWNSSVCSAQKGQEVLLLDINRTKQTRKIVRGVIGQSVNSQAASIALIVIIPYCSHGNRKMMRDRNSRVSIFAPSYGRGYEVGFTHPYILPDLIR